MIDINEIKEYFKNTPPEKIKEEWEAIEDIGVTWEEYLKIFNATTFLSAIEAYMTEAFEKMGDTGDDNYYQKPHFNEENYYFGRFRALEDLQFFLEDILKNNKI